MSNSVHNRFFEMLSSRWVDLSLVVFAALAWGSTFLQMARGTVQLSPNAEIGVFILGAVALCVIVRFLRKKISQHSVQWSHFTGRRKITYLVLLGVALRAAWVTLLPAAPSSDGATYIFLADRLLNGMSYEVGGSYAYWPPGYPLFLAAWLFLMPTAIAVPFSQITVFAIGAFGIYRLARKIAGEPAAMIAVLLFATWPNLIALCSTPEKEALIIALLPWVMYWGFSSSRISSFFSGIALGASVLVQPALQLLIPALVLLLLIRNGLKFIPGALLVILGSFLVIAPWTARNFEVFGEFKLVGTNGGDVLYRANNPLANGGYTERGEIDLSSLSELEMDRKGRELATRWIQENPRSFVTLAFEKQVRFMGDDAVGIYSTFRSDAENRDNRLYVPLKLLANAWWLLAWFFLASYILKGNTLPKDSRLLIWGWFYLFILHSVFESAGKYHVPMIWVLCVALGALCTTRDEREISEKTP